MKSPQKTQNPQKTGDGFRGDMAHTTKSKGNRETGK